jgi:hypothetical protein
MNKAEQQARHLFRHFCHSWNFATKTFHRELCFIPVESKINKWDFYAGIFDLMERRKITLRRLMEIAPEYGISAGVIAMRRSDWLAMRSKS